MQNWFLILFLDLFPWGLTTFIYSVPVSLGVVHQPYGYRLLFDNNNNNYDYSRPVFGTTFDNMTRTRSSQYDTSNPINFGPLLIAFSQNLI